MTGGTIALVTGANQGIGREIARGLAAAGMVVYLGARDERRGRVAARELAAGVGDSAADVRFVQLDVTDQAQIEAAVRRVETEVGRLDVLVNNAGVVVEWGTGPAEITAAQLRRAYEVNVFGPVALTGACLPLLRRSATATVINMSSPLGSLRLLGDPEHPAASRGLLAYSSSKAALFPRGERTPADGARAAVTLALLGADAPTGAFLESADGSLDALPW